MWNTSLGLASNISIPSIPLVQTVSVLPPATGNELVRLLVGGNSAGTYTTSPVLGLYTLSLDSAHLVASPLIGHRFTCHNLT